MFLCLKKNAQACLSLHLSKCHIVGNHMPRLIYTLVCTQSKNVSGVNTKLEKSSQGTWTVFMKFPIKMAERSFKENDIFFHPGSAIKLTTKRLTSIDLEIMVENSVSYMLNSKSQVFFKSSLQYLRY